MVLSLPRPQICENEMKSTYVDDTKYMLISLVTELVQLVFLPFSWGYFDSLTKIALWGHLRQILSMKIRKGTHPRLYLQGKKLVV